MKKILLMLLFGISVVFSKNTTLFFGTFEKITIDLNTKDIKKSQLIINTGIKEIIYNYDSFDKSKNLLKFSNNDLGYIIADLNTKHKISIKVKQYNKKDELIAKSVRMYKEFATELDMKKLPHSSYEDIDKKLNEIYQKILKKYSKDKLFIKKLKISQRLWIKQKEADLKVAFYKRGDKNSTYLQNKSTALKIYTLERIRFLKRIIEER